MTPQELAALSRINNELKHLTAAVQNLVKAVDRAHKNIVTSFRGWYEKPLPPLVEEGINQIVVGEGTGKPVGLFANFDCDCPPHYSEYPEFGHHLDCRSLKDKHQPNDACVILGLGHKDKGGSTCICGYDRIKYPHVGHRIDCPILKGEHSPDDACIPTVGHKDKE